MYLFVVFPFFILWVLYICILLLVFCKAHVTVLIHNKTKKRKKKKDLTLSIITYFFVNCKNMKYQDIYIC